MKGITGLVWREGSEDKTRKDRYNNYTLQEYYHQIHGHLLLMLCYWSLSQITKDALLLFEDTQINMQVTGYSAVKQDIIRELKQTWRRRKRERHLKMHFCNHFWIIQTHYSWKMELNRNQRLGHQKTKLNICHHRFTLSTQLQNRSFHVVERTRTSTKCQKMKRACAKCAKILFFIVKYANLRGFCCRHRRGCLSSLMSGCHQ